MMNCNDVIESNLLKRRFCKDTNLPISVVDNPYFKNRMDLFRHMYPDCWSNFGQFIYEVIDFENEQEYLAYYNEVKDKIIQYITCNEQYKMFLESKFQISELHFPKSNIYSPTNVGKIFCSIDMKKANFSAMRHFSTEIFNNCDTWEQFVSGFTNNKHIINSKYIRQVVLGACNPGRQIKYEKHLMKQLLNMLMSNMEIKVHSLAADEIILEDTGNFEEISKFISENSDLPLRTEQFVLEEIHGTSGFVRTTHDGKTVFKCLDSNILPQVIRYYIGQEIEEADLVFYYGNSLVRYMKPIDNPFITNRGKRSGTNVYDDSAACSAVYT